MQNSHPTVSTDSVETNGQSYSLVSIYFVKNDSIPSWQESRRIVTFSTIVVKSSNHRATRQPAWENSVPFIFDGKKVSDSNFQISTFRRTRWVICVHAIFIMNLAVFSPREMCHFRTTVRDFHYISNVRYKNVWPYVHTTRLSHFFTHRATGQPTWENSVPFVFDEEKVSDSNEIQISRGV